MDKSMLDVFDYNDPLAHLREFDDLDRKERVEEICDDLLMHCHGCWPKVVGMMAVELDHLREENKQHLASVDRIAKREIELCDRADELQEWLANMIDFYDVDNVFANHGNVERSYALKQKYGSNQAISEKAWDVCNNR